MVQEIGKQLMQDPLGKIMQAFVMAVAVWLGKVTQENSVELARQSQRLTGIEAQISVITMDRYTGAQATSDRALLEQRISRLEQWNDRLSGRLADVESAYRKEQRQ